MMKRNMIEFYKLDGQYYRNYFLNTKRCYLTEDENEICKINKKRVRCSECFISRMDYKGKFGISKTPEKCFINRSVLLLINEENLE